LSQGKLDTYIILCQNYYADLGPKAANYIKQLDQIEEQLIQLAEKKSEKRQVLTVAEVKPFAAKIRNLFKGSPKFKAF
jgi:hypothetical protein